MGEFKGPIVEGAYYERYCGRVVGPMTPALMGVYAALPATELTRRVWITHTDPAEVVAELRSRGRVNLGTQSEESDWDEAADLVAEKLGVKS